MSKKKPNTPRLERKYEFDTDFQEAILHYTIQDKEGYKALAFYQDSYFTLAEHQILALAIKRYYNANKTLPKSFPVFKEYLRSVVFRLQGINGVITDDVKEAVLSIGNKLYSKPIRDSEAIFNHIIHFAQYTELKEHIAQADLRNYEAYEDFSKKIQKAISIGDRETQTNSTLLIADIRKRQNRRLIIENTAPTPFWQLNKYLNGGGYQEGSLICIIGRAKRFKTGFLVNLARHYLRLRKRVIYFDFENNIDPISLRFEQSLSKLTQEEVLSGEYNNQIQKKLRKYGRLGVEVAIERLPAYTTDVTGLQKKIDYYKSQGITFDVAVIDYIGLMDSISNNKDETKRISDAYVDVKNFAAYNKFDACFTAHHVTRQASDAREGTRYLPSDIAKCIDIHRHVDALYGLQENEQEKDGGVLRLEIIDQRNGQPEGRVFFWVDYERQHLAEFTRDQVTEYMKQAVLLGDDPNNSPKRKYQPKDNAHRRTKEELRDI
jgi:replicative DNA helicase